MFSNKLQNLIDNSEVVSFDIFDTLIIRSYNQPTDLFRHIEIAKNADGFETKRIAAEHEARSEAGKQNIEEVTLDEIYRHLDDRFQPLKEAEIQQELRCCSADKNMLEAFNYALKNNKRVVIASDMYLPQKTVEKILRNAGYKGYEKLFLSSETKHTKVSGAMFKDILEYTKVPAAKILHIGDNLLSDSDIPANLGIQTFHYLKATEINAYSDDFLFLRGLDERLVTIPLSVMKGLLVKRKQHLSDDWEDFGYQYGGLMTVGFCQWLKNEFDSQGIRKAFFMARDGYIPQKVFQLLCPDFETKYMAASRRCYIWAGMQSAEDIADYLTCHDTNGVNFGDYWNALALDCNELYNKFKKQFKLNKIITFSDKALLKQFFIENSELLQQISEQERSAALEYFAQIGFDDGKLALIDIGWRASVQKFIVNALKLAHKKQDIYGYYLGTVPHSQKSIRTLGFLLDQGNPKDVESNINKTLPLLELMFTAPSAGVVKLLRNSKNEITVKHQELNGNEKHRCEISAKICKGVLQFAKDWLQMTKELPLTVSKDDAYAVLPDFAYKASAKIYSLLQNVAYTAQAGNSKQEIPLYAKYDKNKTFAIICTWPGAESAEKEVSLRLKKAAENIGMNPIFIAPDGYICDEDTNRTYRKINEHDLLFAITIHFYDYKMLDCFHYHVLWNPPEIPLNCDNYLFQQKNYISNDDFLTYDDGGMKNHLKSVLIDDERQLNGNSCLVGSFPKSEMLKPDLSNPKLFYCGMNWEILGGWSKNGRHMGLFRLLDDHNLVTIFGPKKPKGWNVAPWAGYKNYQGEIPFDGFSILQEIHKCGVVLAVSSDAHRRAGAVTNRVYEACAAGAVIISDDNPFMKKHFGDSVLYIDFNKENPLDTYRQIVEKLDWIKANPAKALKLAMASQKIFAEKFCMEVQLQQVLANHENRRKAVAEAMYSQHPEENILAVTYYDAPLFNAAERYRLQHVIKQIQNQNMANITLAIACDASQQDEIQALIPAGCGNIKTVPFALFNKKHSKMLTRGQMLRRIQQQIPHAAFCILQGCEILFSDHFAILKRKLENRPQAYIAYSGCFRAEKDNNRYLHRRGVIPYSDFYNCCVVPSGMFLFSAQTEEFLQPYADDSLDGYEFFAYLNRAVFTHKCEPVYSQHVTCGINVSLPWQYQSTVLTGKMQKNFIQGLVAYDYEQATAKVQNCRQVVQTYSAVGSFDYYTFKNNRHMIRSITHKIMWLKIAKIFCPLPAKRKKINEKIANLKDERKSYKHF